MTDRSLEYRPYLDGLRAIAVLMVFVFHAARPGLPGGFIGVDIFFVLSGYLITRILLKQFDDTSRIGIARFYSRRMRRLLPAVITLVIVVIAREALWGSILEVSDRLRDALATLFYGENWNLIAQADQYFAESLSPSPLRHAWSLSIEEQFYVAWPLILLGVLAISARRRIRTIALIGGLVVLSATAMALLYEPGLVARAYYGTGARVQQPLIGAMLAVFVTRWPASGEGRSRKVWPTVAVGSLLALLAISARITGETEFYYRGGSTVIALLTATLIFGLEMSPKEWFASFLGWSPLRRLGEISYGFYLWHWPIILWLAAPPNFSFWERRVLNAGQFALTLAISVASYILIEHPIRSGTVWLGRLSPRVTILSGTGVVVLAAGIAVASLSPAGLSGSSEADGPVASPTTTSHEVNATEPQVDFNQIAQSAMADRSYEPCPSNPMPCVKSDGASANSPTVALIGDSTAQAYDPALKVLAAKYGFRYVQAAVGGCPISHRFLATGIDGQLHKPSNYTCYEQMPDIYETVLDKYQPDLIIATSWNETNQYMDGEHLVEKGTPEHLEGTEKALRTTVEQLTSRGARLVFIDVLPPGNSVDCLVERGNADECTRPVSAESGEGPYNQIFALISEDMAPIVADISVTDVVCPQDECPVMIDGMVVRYDGGHFTATFSRSLAPLLDQRLNEAGVDLSDIASN